MEDRAVSLKAVISTIYDCLGFFKNDFDQGFFADKIRDLPTITSCEDAISREAMCAEIKDWIKLSKYYHPKSKNNKIPIDELRTRIENLPSVTPNDEDMAIQYTRGYIDGFKEGKAKFEPQEK